MSLTAWLISLSIMLSSSIYAVAKGRSSFFLLCSIPLYKCTTVFWSTYKQINKQQVLGRLWRKGNPSILLVGMQLVQPLWKTVWNFLRKLKMELLFDPAIPLLALYPKIPETPIQKNLCIPMFIAAQFTIAKCWKQPKSSSVSEWIKKLWYIYTMEYYAPNKRRKSCPPWQHGWNWRTIC